MGRWGGVFLGVLGRCNAMHTFGANGLVHRTQPGPKANLTRPSLPPTGFTSSSWSISFPESGIFPWLKIRHGGHQLGTPPRALRDPPPPAWSHSAWRGLLLRDPCGIGQVCFRAFPAQPLSTDTLVGCQVAGTIWSSPLPGYLGPGKGSASFFGEGVFSHRWAWSNHVVTIRSSPVKTIGLETAASQKKKSVNKSPLNRSLAFKFY